MGEIEEKAKVLDIKGAMTTMIITAFGLVAALFWHATEFLRELRHVVSEAH